MTARFDLGDLLDRLLDTGVVVSGDAVLGLAGVDLVRLDLRLLLSGVESARRRAGVPVEALRGRAAVPAPELPPEPLPALPSELAGDPDRPDAGLGQLIVALAEIIRRLLEGQALARLDAGSLTDEEAERLGRALHLLESRLEALRTWFGAAPDRTDAHPAGKETALPWRP